MSNRTNFQLINQLTKHIDTESLQINMSDSIHFTVKTSKELGINDIFEVAKVMEEVTEEEVEFVERREDNIVVFRCLSSKKEEGGYRANSEAVKQRKVPELVEDKSLMHTRMRKNSAKENIIVIIATVIIGGALCYLIDATGSFKAVMNGLMATFVIIMMAFVIILLRDLADD